MRKVNRSREATADDSEAEFAVWVWPEVSVKSIDNFIEGRQTLPNGKPARLPVHRRAELLELRSSALAAYRAGNKELAMERAERLQEKCKWFGEKLISDPTVRERMNRAKTRSGGRPRVVVDEKAVLADVRRGLSYADIETRLGCSPAKISDIVAPHGGAKALRRAHQRKRR